MTARDESAEVVAYVEERLPYLEDETPSMMLMQVKLQLAILKELRASRQQLTELLERSEDLEEGRC